MKKIKLILFDIDNTLVYGERASKYYKQYPRLLEKTLSVCLGVPLESAQEIANEHRRLFGGRGEQALTTYALDASAWHDAMCSLDPNASIKPLPDVQELLCALRERGYLLGAITDGPDTQAERILNAAGIDKNIFSLLIGWKKYEEMPKGGRSDIYKKVIADYKLDPGEILMVGDSLGADIIPAHACGINVLHISEDAHGEFPTIKSIGVLLNYLNKNDQ